MDIKSKRWKRIVSLGGLFLGTGLLVLDLVLAVLWLYSGGTQALLKDAFREDYQQTDAFIDYISDYLNQLLSTVSGVTIDYRQDYADAYRQEKVEITTATESAAADCYSILSDQGATTVTVSEEGRAAVTDSTAAIASQGVETAYSIAESTDESAAAEAIKDAAAEDTQAEEYAYQFEDRNGNLYTVYGTVGAYSWDRKDDKNVLFAVFSGVSPVPLLTNADAGELEEGLPEGYNFLLMLENNQVSIQKDGEALDVYGGGYYTQDSKWYVPGYENFSKGSYPQELKLVLAVKELPARYFDTSNNSYYSNGNDFNACHTIVQSMREARTLYLFWLILAVLGIVLVLMRFVFWRAGSEAKRLLAEKLSHLWWELKAVGFGTVMLMAVYIFFVVMDGSSAYLWEIIHLNSRGWNLSLWLAILMAFFLIEVTGSIFYLCCIDLQYGRPWRKTLVGSIANGIRGLWQLREQRLSFAKKLMSQYLGSSGLIFPICLLGAAVFCLFSIAFAVSSQWLPALLLLLLAALAVGMFYGQYRYARHLNELLTDMQDLTDQIRDIREGHMEAELEVSESGELKESFENLNAIQEGMQTALKEQMKSERMKIELIANVSHDIKTPLTSIISYVEILKQEEDLPEDIKDYIRILENKSQRLKTMVQDVFEVSKAASGELPVKPEVLDYGKLLRQTLADMAEQIESSPVRVRTEIPEEPVPILADGQRLYRVFQNLIVNALKYSLEGSRVYVSLKLEEKQAAVTVKNTSRSELPADVDFTERFVRGDSSRTDGGSGLGLSISRSFTEACGGRFMIRTDADLFTATVIFPLTEQQPAPEEAQEEQEV